MTARVRQHTERPRNNLPYRLITPINGVSFRKKGVSLIERFAKAFEVPQLPHIKRFAYRVWERSTMKLVMRGLEMYDKGEDIPELARAAILEELDVF